MSNKVSKHYRLACLIDSALHGGQSGTTRTDQIAKVIEDFDKEVTQRTYILWNHNWPENPRVEEFESSVENLDFHPELWKEEIEKLGYQYNRDDGKTEIWEIERKR